KYMTHENEWYVRHARRALQEWDARRRAPGNEAMKASERLQVIAPLVKALQHEDPTRRLRAMWALHVIGEVKPELLADAMKDPSEHVRAWAVRLYLDTIRGESSPEAKKSAEWFYEQFWLRAAGTVMDWVQNEQSPAVRRAVASCLQKCPPMY